MVVKINYLFYLFLTSTIFFCVACSSSDSSQISSDVNYTRVSALNSNVNDVAANDSAPEISSNGLELYFQSNRTGGVMDLFVSTRVTTNDSWGAATSLGATVNSVGPDRTPSLSSDGLTLFFASDDGGVAGFDLYMSTRVTLNDAWSIPTNLGAVINSNFMELGPSISSDGLSLFFQSDAPGAGGIDIFVSTRTTLADPWSPPVSLGALVNSTGDDGQPEIASDGLSLYFHSTRIGGPGAINIWRTTRTSINGAWAIPVVLPAPVNSTAIDAAPALSDDWQTLYFASDFGGASRDIFQAVP